ncbi:glycosyltransferase [Salarchaeum sp. III]|uniref:glycosyltransferase n=1 Tax=Salarchaeum sp. III TaxID=3107927 RepID=UPI002EDA0A8A
MVDDYPKVSVLIPTFNEEEIIQNRLDNLMDVEYPKGKVEIVIVDSGDDETVERAREYLANQDIELTIIRQTKRRGVASAVNIGVEQASGDIIFRTDADSRTSPGTLIEAVETLSNEEIGAVTGQQSEVIGGSSVEQDYRNYLSTWQKIESKVDSTYICHGPCFAFEADLYKPLPENTIADDTAEGLEIRRQGKYVKFNEKMEFAEAGASKFTSRRARKDRRAAGLVQTLIRNRDMLGKFGKYGRIILPVNWLLMIVMPILGVLTFLGASLVSLVWIGPFGIVVPGLFVVALWLGGREKLGPFQPIYSIIDINTSLVSGIISTLRSGNTSGMWDIDRSSREEFR